MLRVVDLFCGPGGISEGLRLAGFLTVFALDRDAAAVGTFRHNHPEADVVQEDVDTLDPSSLPPFDVLVGGPPCIEFSTSKGGRANVLEGLRLVQAFLRVVHATRPRYWIMENVPRLMRHLPDCIPLRWLGLDQDGDLPVPVRGEFNTADYGVPQLRRRSLLGNFPLPRPTHFDRQAEPLTGLMERSKPWRMLRMVLAALPDPLRAPGTGVVPDPNYSFSLEAGQVSDHFHEVLLSDDEVARIREVKSNHPYMGRMAFPDELDRPARTVVATQLGRETLVIGCEHGDRAVYRRATVRECATLQSFPLHYQFLGSSLNARYRLVGDAVPPLLAWAIGREILKAEGRTAPDAPLVRTGPVALAPAVTLQRQRRKKVTFPLDRRFRQMVPGKEVRGCRVDLDNLGSEPGPAVLRPAGSRNLVEWTTRLHVGEGKAVMQERPFTVEEALWEFAGHCLAHGAAAWRSVLQFLGDADRQLAGQLPDATTLQAVWTGRWEGAPGPAEVVAMLATLVEQRLPADEFAEVRVPRSGRFDLVPPRGLRVRIVAGLAVTAFACALINADGRWAASPDSRRYCPGDWSALTAEAHAVVPVVEPPTEGFARVLRLRQAESRQGETLLDASA